MRITAPNALVSNAFAAQLRRRTPQGAHQQIESDAPAQVYPAAESAPSRPSIPLYPPQTALIAHILAMRADAPQTRAKRRASIEHSCACYTKTRQIMAQMHQRSVSQLNINV